jgi:hypothetical protein
MISTPERSNGLTTSNRIANPNVPNRRFQFDKRYQLIIRTHNGTLYWRRDAHEQSRLFARVRPKLLRSPNSIRLC